MRVFGNIRFIALAASTLSLTGCFDNLSGISGGLTSSSQTNGVTLNDSGFANETGPIDTNAQVIGTYSDASGNAGYGIMVDLNSSLVTTLGQSAVTSILATIDSNSTMQARTVAIHFPGFGFKAMTTLGAIAAGNSGKMRNIMNVRPRLVRIDLTTSALQVPTTPSVIQMNNSNKTILTYGGMIEGDFIRRMTVLIPFAGVNAGFLPSTSVPNFGDGLPTASPQEVASSVKLIPLTGAAGTAIYTHFANIMTKPPYGPSVAQLMPSSIQTINQTYGSLALAVHLGMNTDGTTPVCPVTPGMVAAIATDNTVLATSGCNLDGTRRIDAAYLININPANNAGPETGTLCNAGFDQQEQAQPYGNSGAAYNYSHPQACNCYLDPGTGCLFMDDTPASVPKPTASQFYDPWPMSIANQWPLQLVNAVNTYATNAKAPATFLVNLGATSLILNGFTLTTDN
jgi:hypothetical protein